MQAAHGDVPGEMLRQVMNTTLQVLIVARQIQRDMPRTWVTKYLAGAAGGLLESTERVLVGFAHERPQIGYCQGMNSVAVALVLVARNGASRCGSSEQLAFDELSESCMADMGALSEEASGCPEEGEAITMLCNLVDDVLPPAFWANTSDLPLIHPPATHSLLAASADLDLPSLAAIQASSVVVKRIIEATSPAVASLLESTLPIAVFVVRFLPALFVGVLPLETAMRVLDGAFDQGSVHEWLILLA